MQWRATWHGRGAGSGTRRGDWRTALQLDCPGFGSDANPDVNRPRIGRARPEPSRAPGGLLSPFEPPATLPPQLEEERRAPRTPTPPPSSARPTSPPPIGTAYPNSPIVHRHQRPGTATTPSSFFALEDNMSGVRAGAGIGTATCIVRRHQHMLITTFPSTIVSTFARRHQSHSHTPHATHHTYAAAPMGHDRWSS